MNAPLPKTTKLINGLIADNHFYLNNEQNLNDYKIKNHKFLNYINPLEKFLTPNLSLMLSEIVNETDKTVPCIVVSVLVYDKNAVLDFSSVETFVIPLIPEKIDVFIQDKNVTILDIPHPNELLTNNILVTSTVLANRTKTIWNAVNELVDLFAYETPHLSQFEVSNMVDMELELFIDKLIKMCFYQMKDNSDIECQQVSQQYEQATKELCENLSRLINEID